MHHVVRQHPFFDALVDTVVPDSSLFDLASLWSVEIPLGASVFDATCLGLASLWVRGDALIGAERVVFFLPSRGANGGQVGRWVLWG